MGYIMIIMTLIKNYLFMKLVETLREKNTVPFDASVADRNAGWWKSMAWEIWLQSWLPPGQETWQGKLVKTPYPPTKTKIC